MSKAFPDLRERSSPLAASVRINAYCLCLAAAVLFFCSMSSPAYPINDWTDANIYFTIGKGMTRGMVVYRDLYDHKGPLLYALHALCALLSPMSFLGVFLLEVFCAAAFLRSAYRLFTLYGVRRAAYFALPALALVVYTSYSFQQGDSAEELCLPLLAATLCDLCAYFKAGAPSRPDARQLARNGFLFGCVFWMKFTMIGLHAAYLAALFFALCTRGEWRQAFRCVGWFFVGFLLATLPWLCYFGVNGAVLDWLKTYLYDNLFLYSTSDSSIGLFSRAKDMLKSGLAWVCENPQYSLLTFIGVAWSALRRGAARIERLPAAFAAALCALGVFIGGKSYPYYGLVLAAFAPLGFIPLCLWLDRRLNALATQRRKPFALCALVCAVCVALCPVLSPNVARSFGLPREATMQYRFAAILNRYDQPTLLNYGFMDAGFYTACGIVPNVKYFHQTNVPLQEMLDEQVRYIDEGVCDFVVTRGKQPQSIAQHYELIATEDSPGFWYDQVFLYRRKGLRELVR
ncbi:MAG: hypothetical protein RR301_04555 [Clostridia bacterium]